MVETQSENQTPTTETATSETGNQAQSLMALEKLILNYLNDMERLQNELKKQREMLENILMNDTEYQKVHAQAKGAAKEKAMVKANLMNRPEAKILGDKVADLRKDVNEKKQNLSNHLQEYAKLAGTNQFEDEEGQVREIVYVAKVVKRSNKFRT